MSLGQPCDRHNIPTSVCSLCKGANEERERILANIIAAYPDEEVRTYRSTIIQVIESNK